MARRVLGLDIGSHAVKAAELRQTLRGVELVQLRVLPLDDPAPALASELREFVQTHDLPVDHVVVSLAGDRISTRRLSFPFRDRRKIGPAVPFELEAQVPFELDDFVVDWQIVSEAKAHTEVAATLAPRAEVALLLETLREAGLDPRIVEAEGLVLGQLSALFDLPGVRLLADVGHRKTTLCLCVDGRAVAARTIPVAGLAVTQAVARERSIGDLEAERVKIDEGVLGGGTRPASPAASAVVERLAREFMRTLGSLEPLLAGAGPVQQIDLLGGSAHLHRLDEALAERLGVPTARLALPTGELGAAALAAGDPLLFAPALALAMRGSLRGPAHMNLRKDELAQRLDLRKVGRELRWTGTLTGLALVLGLASVVTNLALSSRRAERLEAQAVALHQQAFPGRPVPASPLAGMQEGLRAAQRRADTLGVYGGNLSALDVLGEISARVPRDLDVVFEELVIDRQVVQVKGHSPSFGSVDRLRAELSRYTPFSEITVGDITSDTRRGGQNFSVRISLADLAEAS
jgi:type IV pilus assembly protein PilM